MTCARPLSAIALGLVLGLSPAVAQTALFNDGPALGGSTVFSEGFNPLGNAARFDQIKSPTTFCMTFVDGDQAMSDTHSALGSIATALPSDSARISESIRQLAGSPWALRTRAYGISFLADQVNGAYIREQFNSVRALADTQANHLDSADALLLNGTWLDVRRAQVDRMALGSLSRSEGTNAGFTVRLERWSMGSEMAAVNAASPQVPLVSGSDPFQFDNAPLKTTALALDFGFSMELMEGLRLGGVVNRVNAKRFWDVEEKPQGRVGLQFDIGYLAKFSVESDLNATMRMPFPVKQRSSSASLRIAASRAVTLLLGAERKQIEDASITRGGATLQFTFPGFSLSVGMQYSKDHPLKGFTAVFN